MPDSFFIPIRQNRIHVHQFGNGPRLIIAFHGFGESGKNFALFEPFLPPDFTLFAPDLPLHGTTDWKKGYFYAADVQELVDVLLARGNTATFSLLGYSMGGKAALSLTPHYIQQLQHLVLAAPDGLKPNFWYNFVTRTLAGRLLFRYVTFHPAVFQFMLTCGLRFSLMNESIYKFVKRHMRDAQVRKLVFGAWNCMKKLRPDIPEVIRLIKAHQLPTAFYFGRYDRIFPPALGDKYNNIPSIHIKVTEGGHQLITESVAQDIIAFLKAD